MESIAGVQADFEDGWTKQSEAGHLSNIYPAQRKSEIEYHTMLVKTVVHYYNAVILNWAQCVENTTEYARGLSLIQVILILSEA